MNEFDEKRRKERELKKLEQRILDSKKQASTPIIKEGAGLKDINLVKGTTDNIDTIGKKAHISSGDEFMSKLKSLLKNPKASEVVDNVVDIGSKLGKKASGKAALGMITGGIGSLISEGAEAAPLGEVEDPMLMKEAQKREFEMQQAGPTIQKALYENAENGSVDKQILLEALKKLKLGQ